MTFSQGKAFAVHRYTYTFGDTHEQNEDQDKALHVLEYVKRNVQRCATDYNKAAKQNNSKESYSLYY